MDNDLKLLKKEIKSLSKRVAELELKGLASAPLNKKERAELILTRSRLAKEDLEKELDDARTLYPERIQAVLDEFDFDKCEEMAERCGFTYRDNEKITAEELARNADEMFQKLIESESLESKPCGRLQLGRLIVSQFSDESETWYTMGFIIEYSEDL